MASQSIKPPPVVEPVWPWQLDALAARQIGGWLALLGVGGITIAREVRWSAWRVGLGSIALWHVLVLIAAVLNPQDFTSPMNWYLVAVVLVLAAMAAVYATLEFRQRRRSLSAVPAGAHGGE